MKPIPVIASANSRLEADVMLIRLRRAGVACQNISALFPQHSMPNAVACWLKLDQKRSLHLGQETIMVAGRIRHELGHAGDATTMVDLLEAAGINHQGARALEEKLEQGHILLAVSARHDDEAAIAWHVFKHVSADLIVCGERHSAAKPRVAPVTPLVWSAVAA